DQVATARVFFSKMVKAKIGYDPVDPGIERTFKAEAGQVDIGAQEGFLVNVLPIFMRACQVNGKPQHWPVIVPHQFFKSRSVALLRLADEREIIHASRATPGQRRNWIA